MKTTSFFLILFLHNFCFSQSISISNKIIIEKNQVMIPYVSERVAEITIDGETAPLFQEDNTFVFGVAVSPKYMNNKIKYCSDNGSLISVSISEINGRFMSGPYWVKLDSSNLKLKTNKSMAQYLRLYKKSGPLSSTLVLIDGKQLIHNRFLNSNQKLLFDLTECNGMLSLTTQHQDTLQVWEYDINKYKIYFFRDIPGDYKPNGFRLVKQFITEPSNEFITFSINDLLYFADFTNKKIIQLSGNNQALKLPDEVDKENLSRYSFVIDKDDNTLHLIEKSLLTKDVQFDKLLMSNGIKISL